MDQSGSIDNTELSNMIDFVANVTSFFQIGQDAVQVGVVRFALMSELFITLGQFPVKSVLIQRMRTLINISTNLGTHKNITGALQVATSELKSNRRRSNAKSAILLFTDGTANRGGDPVQTAVDARNDGIQIFSFGIGNELNTTQLRLISNQPTSTHVFTSQTFDSSTLSQSVSSLAQGVCIGEY